MVCQIVENAYNSSAYISSQNVPDSYHKQLIFYLLYLLDWAMCFAISLPTSGLQPGLGALPQTFPLSLPPPAALLTDCKKYSLYSVRLAVHLLLLFAFYFLCLRCSGMNN